MSDEFESDPEFNDFPSKSGPARGFTVIKMLAVLGVTVIKMLAVLGVVALTGRVAVF